MRCIELGATDYLTKPINPRSSARASTRRWRRSALRDLELEYHRAAARAHGHHRAAEGRADPLPVAADRGSSSPRRRASSCWPATGGRSPSAFCDLRGFTTFAEQAEPGGALRRAGRVPPHDRRDDHRARRDARALRRRRRDGLLQRPDPAGGPRRARRAHGGRRCASGSGRWPRAGSKRGYELGFGVGIAVGYATLGRIGFEGRYDYGAIGNVVILASRLSSQAAANQILLSQRAAAMVEGMVDVSQSGRSRSRGSAGRCRRAMSSARRPRARFRRLRGIRRPYSCACNYLW